MEKISEIKKDFGKKFEDYYQNNSQRLSKIEEFRKQNDSLIKILVGLGVGLTCLVCMMFFLHEYNMKLIAELSLCGLCGVLVILWKKKIIQHKMNHFVLDFIMDYFPDFRNQREEGGFILYRFLILSELFGKKIHFRSEDSFIGNVDHKRVLVAEAAVNYVEYLLMTMEVENKYFRPTMAQNEGGIFKFDYKQDEINISFGSDGQYQVIAKKAYEDISNYQELFYEPFWSIFSELKACVWGSSVQMAFFDDKLVVALREDTNLFEPVAYDMKKPMKEKLLEVAWQINCIIQFADLYDEQRDVLLEFSKKNELNFKEITEHRFL